MNGIHDMGGMHGMGPIVYEKNEPVFHEPWEGRAWALSVLPLFLPDGEEISGTSTKSCRPQSTCV